MKIAYHAEDAIDAKLVSDILNGNGVYAQVRGAHMQGAVGEAAAMGNVKVWVNDQDLSQAKSVIEDWDNAGYAAEDAELFAADEDESLEQNPAPQSVGHTVLVASFFLILLVLIFGAFIQT